MLFEMSECSGRQEKQREVDGEGVVLLIGGEREEAENDGREDDEEQDAALGEALPGGLAEAMTLAPCDGDGGGSEEAPGKEPDDVESPVERGGEFVVVARDAGAEEARDVLVVEVEPCPAGV